MQFLSIPFLLLKQHMHLALLQEAQKAYADASASLLLSCRDEKEEEEKAQALQVVEEEESRYDIVFYC